MTVAEGRGASSVATCGRVLWKLLLSVSRGFCSSLGGAFWGVEWVSCVRISSGEGALLAWLFLVFVDDSLRFAMVDCSAVFEGDGHSLVKTLLERQNS